MRVSLSSGSQMTTTLRIENELRLHIYPWTRMLEVHRQNLSLHWKRDFNDSGEEDADLNW